MIRILLAPTLVLLLVQAAFADIYKYVDESGVVCYTDAPFGKKAKKILKQKQEEPAALPENKGRSGKKTSFESRDYGSYVTKAASKYEIEPELIHAVIKTESNGNHRAVSRKGAMGLMQLMPSTANDLNVSNPFNPEENIEGGTRYLRYLLEKFNGDLTLALAAYNSGPKTVEKYGTVPPISETQQYVRKVYSLYKGGGAGYPALKTQRAERQERPQPTPVYKVVMEDGTVLFTNAPLVKSDRLRF